MATCKHDSLKDISLGLKKRVGRPRLNWAIETLKELWTEARSLTELEELEMEFNEDNIRHIDRLQLLTDRYIEKFKIKLELD